MSYSSLETEDDCSPVKRRRVTSGIDLEIVFTGLRTRAKLHENEQIVHKLAGIKDLAVESLTASAKSISLNETNQRTSPRRNPIASTSRLPLASPLFQDNWIDEQDYGGGQTPSPPKKTRRLADESGEWAARILSPIIRAERKSEKKQKRYRVDSGEADQLEAELAELETVDAFLSGPARLRREKEVYGNKGVKERNERAARRTGKAPESMRKKKGLSQARKKMIVAEYTSSESEEDLDNRMIQLTAQRPNKKLRLDPTFQPEDVPLLAPYLPIVPRFTSLELTRQSQMEEDEKEFYERRIGRNIKLLDPRVTATKTRFLHDIHDTAFLPARSSPPPIVPKKLAPTHKTITRIASELEMEKILQDDVMMKVQRTPTKARDKKEGTKEGGKLPPRLDLVPIEEVFELDLPQSESRPRRAPLSMECFRSPVQPAFPSFEEISPRTDSMLQELDQPSPPVAIVPQNPLRFHPAQPVILDIPHHAVNPNIISSPPELDFDQSIQVQIQRLPTPKSNFKFSTGRKAAAARTLSFVSQSKSHLESDVAATNEKRNTLKRELTFLPAGQGRKDYETLVIDDDGGEMHGQESSHSDSDEFEISSFDVRRIDQEAALSRKNTVVPQHSTVVQHTPHSVHSIKKPIRSITKVAFAPEPQYSNPHNRRITITTTTPRKNPPSSILRRNTNEKVLRKLSVTSPFPPPRAGRDLFSPDESIESAASPRILSPAPLSVFKGIPCTGGSFTIHRDPTP